MGLSNIVLVEVRGVGNWKKPGQPRNRKEGKSRKPEKSRNRQEIRKRNHRNRKAPLYPGKRQDTRIQEGMHRRSLPGQGCLFLGNRRESVTDAGV